MAEVKDFLKIPDKKWVGIVITLGAAIFITAKVIDSIYQAQIFTLQKKIYKYQIAEYTAKYGDIESGTLQEQINNTANNVAGTIAKIV